MKRKNLLMYILFIAAFLIIALPLAGCTGSGNTAVTTASVTTAASTTASVATAASTTAASTTAASTTAATTSVTIESFLFNPDSLTIKAGETVTWTNKDSMAHTVTEDKGVFDSGSINNGATYSFTFKTAGTFTYHCAIHPSMTGKIIVQ